MKLFEAFHIAFILICQSATPDPLKPYDGPSVRGVDTSTLTGKVMTGYQGWFYLAMFDEVDEGTAIFRCTNQPPGGTNPFLTYEGLPSDHYLWLTGEGARLLRDQRPVLPGIPLRIHQSP